MTNPADFGATTAEIDPMQFGAIANIDDEAGAPISVRNAVAASVTPGDKLSTLQNYYPDARSWGDDNFLFTDPKTGNNTLFNPKGMDMGDISEQGRLIAEFLGGFMGGTAATVGGQLGPQIATPEEIVTVPLAIGAGAAVGAQAYDAFAGIFYPHEETRGAVERVGSAGVDVMANAVGQRAGDLLGEVAKQGLSKGSALARKGADEMVKAFEAMGATPTAGAISGSKTIQNIETALSRLPASADIIGEKYAKLLDDIGVYVEKIARVGAPVEGRDVVGAKIKSGAESFVRRFQEKAGELYDAVDEFIPRSTRVTGNSLRAELSRVAAEFSDDPQFADFLTSPLFKQIKKAYEGSEAKGGIAYGTLKALRTKIGRMLDDPLLVDAPMAELKQLYGALTDDMTAAAVKVGGYMDEQGLAHRLLRGTFGGKTPALEAMDRANRFWAAGRARIDDVLNPVVNKVLSEEIFTAALQGAKNGPSRLRALKKSLPVDDWNQLVGQQIREMGRATPGAQDITGELFSPATFLTTYNKLSPASRKVLFTGKQYQGLEEAVTNLTVVSAGLKEASKMANTSNTAQNLIYMNMLTGGMGGLYGSQDEGGAAAGALKGMVAATAIPAITAKLITSPKFINWLADSATIAANPNGIAAHLGRLATIAVKDKELAPAIYEYLDTLQVGAQ